VAHALDNPTTVPTTRVCLALPFLASGLSRLVSWQAGLAENVGFGLEPAWRAARGLAHLDVDIIVVERDLARDRDPAEVRAEIERSGSKAQRCRQPA